MYASIYNGGAGTVYASPKSGITAGADGVPPYLRAALRSWISAYYSQRYQIIFSVHEDTDHWHIHFVMNTVSFVDGKMFSEGPYELAQFKEYVEALIRIYENRFNRQMLGYD